jgi:hypothetical protein
MWDYYSNYGDRKLSIPMYSFKEKIDKGRKNAAKSTLTAFKQKGISVDGEALFELCDPCAGVQEHRSYELAPKLFEDP